MNSVQVKQGRSVLLDLLEALLCALLYVAKLRHYWKCYQPRMVRHVRPRAEGLSEIGHDFSEPSSTSGRWVHVDFTCKVP